MLYIIIGGITLIALLLLIIIVNYNKFQFAIIKIEEAESNADVFLKKKYDLIKRIVPIIGKKIKNKDFLSEVNESIVNLNHFELNDRLNSFDKEIYKVLDENENLLKNEKIAEVLDEINDNDEDLVASIRFYNDSVSTYNKYIMSFPSNIIRLFFGYKKKDFYSEEKKEMFEILKKDEKVVEESTEE